MPGKLNVDCVSATPSTAGANTFAPLRPTAKLALPAVGLPTASIVGVPAPRFGRRAELAMVGFRKFEVQMIAGRRFYEVSWCDATLCPLLLHSCLASARRLHRLGNNRSHGRVILMTGSVLLCRQMVTSALGQVVHTAWFSGSF